MFHRKNRYQIFIAFRESKTSSPRHFKTLWLSLNYFFLSPGQSHLHIRVRWWVTFAGNFSIRLFSSRTIIFYYFAYTMNSNANFVYRFCMPQNKFLVKLLISSLWNKMFNNLGMTQKTIQFPHNPPTLPTYPAQFFIFPLLFVHWELFPSKHNGLNERNSI